MTATTLLYFLGVSMAPDHRPRPGQHLRHDPGDHPRQKQAIVTALGMCSGVSVHTTAAAFGISALFYSSVLAFNIVKYAGAAYLLYLACMTIRERSTLRLAGGDDRPLRPCSSAASS